MRPSWTAFTREGLNEKMDETAEGAAELLDDGAIDVEFAHLNGDNAVVKAKRDTSSTASQAPTVFPFF